MIRFASPLRYPGGKGSLAEFLANLMITQRPACTTYIEPFAGGAGAALRLLLDERVDEIVLNDLDRGVASFWKSVLNQPGEFISLIQSAELTINEWTRQLQIYKSGSTNELELGFATFYLNRTNRSGILTARPIGGLSQAGRWRMDARFNRDELSHRVALISRYKSRMTVLNQDAVTLLQTLLPVSRSTLIYVDPPYLDKGEDLYFNNMKWSDHKSLAEVLSQSDARWMATYNCDERLLQSLYPLARCAKFSINHAAQRQHVGSELAFFSSNLIVEDLRMLSGSRAEFVR